MRLQLGLCRAVVCFLLLLNCASCKKAAGPVRNIATFQNGAVITLLPGFELRDQQGIDSYVGVIRKPGGLTIQYDIGEMAGRYSESAEWTKGEVWRKRAKINGDTLVCVYTVEHRLTCTALEARANFYAHAESETEIQQMLQMTSTYAPGKDLNRLLTTGN